MSHIKLTDIYGHSFVLKVSMIKIIHYGSYIMNEIKCPCSVIQLIDEPEYPEFKQMRCVEKADDIYKMLKG